VPEMSQLLRFELRKLFRARILYICAGIIVLLILIFAGTDKLIDLSIQEMSDFINTPSEAIEDYTEVPDDQIEFEEEMSEGMINSMGINPNSRTGLARLLGALNNIYVIMVIGVFAAVYICGDFGNTVIKNIISKGYTRTQVYFAKYLITLIVSLAYALLAMLMGFLCGVIMWNAGSGWSARVLLLILLLMMPYAEYIPMASLAAVLVIVSYNMSGWRAFRGLLRNPKSDVTVLLVTFLLTVVFDLTIAIEMGLIIACALFIKRVMETTEISVIRDEIDPSDEADMKLHDRSLQIPEGCAVYEINGPYFFGIANKFDDLQTNLSHGRKPRVQIIRMRKVPFIDSTGIHNLSNLIQMKHEEGTHVILSGVTPKVHSQLEKAGFYQKMNPDHICPHIDVALERARAFLAGK